MNAHEQFELQLCIHNIMYGYYWYQYMIREEEFSWGTGTKTACSGNSSQNLVAERLQLELSSGDHDSSSIAPQRLNNEEVVVIIRVAFWMRWIKHVAHPFALVRVVKLACIAPAVVGLGTGRRGRLGSLRRFRVCNVFRVLAVVTVRCLPGHEIAVAEGTPHWRSSRRCCGRLDLAGRVGSNAAFPATSVQRYSVFGTENRRWNRDRRGALQRYPVFGTENRRWNSDRRGALQKVFGIRYRKPALKQW